MKYTSRFEKVGDVKYRWISRSSICFVDFFGIFKGEIFFKIQLLITVFFITFDKLIIL